MRKKLGNFIHFIENESSFNHDERNHILHNLEDKHNRRMINLILILSSWSIISFFIESGLIGGGLVTEGIARIYEIPQTRALFTFFLEVEPSCIICSGW